MKISKSHLKITAAVSAVLLTAAIIVYSFFLHHEIQTEGRRDNVFVMKNVHSGGFAPYGSYEVSFDDMGFHAEKFLKFGLNALQILKVKNFKLVLNIDDEEKFKKGMSSADAVDIFRGLLFAPDTKLVRGRMVNSVEMNGARFEIVVNGEKRFTIISSALRMKRGKPVFMGDTVIADYKTNKMYDVSGCVFASGFSRIIFKNTAHVTENEKRKPAEISELIIFE